MRRVTGSSPVSSTKYVPQRDIAKRSFCELPLVVHNEKVVNTVKKFSVAGRRIVWPEDLDTGATHAFSLICLSPSFLLPACSSTANRVVASSLRQQRYPFLLRLCNYPCQRSVFYWQAPGPSCAKGIRLRWAIWYMARGNRFFNVHTHGINGIKRKAKPRSP